MAGIKQIRKTRPQKQPRQPRVNEPQDVWLNETIDNYLMGTMHPPRSGVFHPSTLSNKCDRAVWLIYHGHMVSTPLEPNLNRIFQNGNYLERRVEHWFSKLGLLVGREVSVKWDTPPISGRIDFIIRHQEFGFSPVELKSINTSGFGKLNRAKPEHELQLQMYLNMGNYDTGTVLYENKNDQKIKSFIITRNYKQWDDLLTRCFNIPQMPKPPNMCTGEYWCACKNVPFESEE